MKLHDKQKKNLNIISYTYGLMMIEIKLDNYFYWYSSRIHNMSHCLNIYWKECFWMSLFYVEGCGWDDGYMLWVNHLYNWHYWKHLLFNSLYDTEALPLFFHSPWKAHHSIIMLVPIDIYKKKRSWPIKLELLFFYYLRK